MFWRSLGVSGVHEALRTATVLSAAVDEADADNNIATTVNDQETATRIRRLLPVIPGSRCCYDPQHHVIAEIIVALLHVSNVSSVAEDVPISISSTIITIGKAY